MRVLIVGTNRACHERLRAAGHELVLMVPRSKLSPADTSDRYRHVVVLDDTAELNVWVGLASALHQEQAFGAVAAFNEGTYEIVDAISSALSVPCTIDVALFERVRDKARARAIVTEAGIVNCRYVQARGRTDIRRAIDLIGLPCIVKPVDAEGSVAVHRIDSTDTIDTVLNMVSADRLAGPMLVEELLVGAEFSVEGLSNGTRHQIVAITKKYIDGKTFVECGHLVPAPISEADSAEIVGYVTEVLDALGFHDCPSHTEIMLTADGPRLIETHNRIGGDRIMDLVRHATGIDLYELVARQAIGEPLDHLPANLPTLSHAAVWFANPVAGPELTLSHVTGLQQARELAGVQTVEVVKPLGSRQSPGSASSERSALAVALGSTAQRALTAAWTAIDSLTFDFRWAPPVADKPPTAVESDGRQA